MERHNLPDLITFSLSLLSDLAPPRQLLLIGQRTPEEATFIPGWTTQAEALVVFPARRFSAGCTSPCRPLPWDAAN